MSKRAVPKLNVEFDGGEIMPLGRGGDLASGHHESLFAGSGISLAGPDPLPTWTDFVKGTLQALLKVAFSSFGVLRPLTIAQKRVIDSVVDAKKPPYIITDMLIRRLGKSYLDIVEKAFASELLTDSGPRPSSDIHRKLMRNLLDGDLQVIITTNFDLRLENALAHLIENHSDKYQRLTLGGDIDVAAKSLAERRNWIRERVGRSVVVVVPSWENFKILVQLFPTFSHTNLPFRFLLKVHGSASQPDSCVDSHLQRSQGLPAPVQTALCSIWANTRVTVLGHSGAELAKNPDYFQAVTCASFRPVNIRWLTMKGSKVDEAVDKLKKEILQLGKERSELGSSGPGSTTVQNDCRFEYKPVTLKFTRDGTQRGEFSKHVLEWAQEMTQPWCCAALLDLLVDFEPKGEKDTAMNSKLAEESNRMQRKLWATLGGAYEMERKRMFTAAPQIAGGSVLYRDVLQVEHGVGGLIEILNRHQSNLGVFRENYTHYDVSHLLSIHKSAKYDLQPPRIHRFEDLKTAMEILLGLSKLPRNHDRYLEILGAGLLEVRLRLQRLEDTVDKDSVNNGDFYGNHSDMWAFWAARSLVERIQGGHPLLASRLRLLRSARMSASINGNTQATEILDKWWEVLRQENVEDFEKLEAFSKQPPEVKEGELLSATHVFIVDLDPRAPTHFMQDIPYGDFLRGLLTYALMLRRRIIVTKNIFNSRTLVTEVLCPLEKGKEGKLPQRKLNEDFVQCMDIWVTEAEDEAANEAAKKGEEPNWARKLRCSFTQEEDFFYEEIPKDALDPLIRYFNKSNQRRTYTSKAAPTTSTAYVAKLEDLLGTKPHQMQKEVIDILRKAHFSWLDQDKAKNEFCSTSERLLNLMKNETVTDNRPSAARSKAYAQLKVAPLRAKVSMNDAPSTPSDSASEEPLLVNVALKSLVDAPYMLNLPIYYKIPALASESSKHLLELASLAVKCGEYREAVMSPPNKNKSLTSFAALRAISGSDFDDARLNMLKMAKRSGRGPESLGDLSDFEIKRLKYLPNKPSDVTRDMSTQSYLQKFSSEGVEGTNERKKVEEIAQSILKEIDFPKSEPVPSLYKLPFFTWGNYFYTWHENPPTGQTPSAVTPERTGTR